MLKSAERHYNDSELVYAFITKNMCIFYIFLML